MRAVDYSSYKALNLVKHDGVLTIMLSNPGKRNAVTAEMGVELTDIWDDIWRDDEVRVIVLTGDGEDFCSGADVSRLGVTSNEGAPVKSLTRNVRKHVMGIIDCEKPVIAKVRGVAYGLGINLALACDIVYVSEDARLCDSHVKVGMVAGDGGVLLWPFAVGFHRAKEYLMTGESLDGKTAERIGLVNRCFPKEELDLRVQELVDKLLALPPHAVNYTKSSINIALKHVASAGFEASMAYELYTQQTEDYKEATTALKAKRRPVYKGK